MRGEERSKIGEVPVIRSIPRDIDGLLPTLVLYHGWSSSKESQRFRAFILSSLGYQVISPDAIHHGERGTLDYYDPENAKKYFWPTILKNLEESKSIIDYAIENYDADPDRIGILGHSMGGFTAAGIFTHNPKIKALVVFNGSCNWKYSNDIFKQAIGMDNSEDLEDIEKSVNFKDPMANMDLIIDRPILMLHGNKDSLVDIKSQRMFYDKIRPLYSNSNMIELIEYNNLNHFVTTNMMEEAAHWFKKYL